MHRRSTIRFVITDLDNTLYDWYSAFVPAFYALVDNAASLMNTDREELLNQLQTVHRRHSNSEHPFAILETDVVISKFPNYSRREIVEALNPAFEAFDRIQAENLALYEGVEESLKLLCEKGVLLVAYTDARATNSLSRLLKLRIRKYFARLYAPAPVVFSDEFGDVKDPFLQLLPPGDRKPNPETLNDIRHRSAFSQSETLYIGDSIVRDIYMAKQAGLQAAWAQFGTQYNKSLWPMLVRVTHWTSDDVEREQTLRKHAEGTEPDCVLEQFSDIFKYYRFAAR